MERVPLHNEFSKDPKAHHAGESFEVMDRMARWNKIKNAEDGYRRMSDLQSRKTGHLPMTTEETQQLDDLHSKFREAQDALARGKATDDESIWAEIANNREGNERKKKEESRGKQSS